MPIDVTSRTYATAGDRAANAANGEGERTGRQRSGSTHRHYRSGSVERVHWHNNAHGGSQFEHTLGGVDRNGVAWGAQPPGGYVR
ncbi:MAG: hypothetical protein RLZZ618_1186 [Pseudomonadota bacterium]|jgi:hypothetical protein